MGKCEKAVNATNNLNDSKSNVIKDILFKLIHFTFPMNPPDPSSDRRSQTIHQSEEILFHSINVWIALLLNIMPNDYLFHHLFMSEEVCPAFGYLLSNLLDLIRNDDKLIRNGSLK